MAPEPIAPEKFEEIAEFYFGFRGVLSFRLVHGEPTVIVATPGRTVFLPVMLPGGRPVKFEVVKRPPRLQDRKGRLIADFARAKKLKQELRASLEAKGLMSQVIQIETIAAGGGKYALQVLVIDHHALSEIPRTYKGSQVDVDVYHRPYHDDKVLLETDRSEVLAVMEDARTYFEHLDGFIDLEIVESTPTEGFFGGIPSYHLRALFDGEPPEDVKTIFSNIRIDSVDTSAEKATIH